MTTKRLIILSAVLAFLTGSSISMAAELVHSVEDAYYSITRTNPPQLKVVAKGKVTSGGWSFPALVVYARQKPPAQGVLEYDFVARAPAADRLVIQQMMPIHTNNLIHDYYPAITAIKINAKTNSKVIEVKPPEPSDW